MLYKFLYEKYLINNSFSVSSENSIFSTLLIFASELGLNIITLFIIFFGELFLPFKDKMHVIFLIVGSMLVGIIISFIILHKKKIISLIKEEKESIFIIKISSIAYSIITYSLFLLTISQIEDWII